jgi:signal peptidase I
VRLNLSDQPITAELLAEALKKSGSGQVLVSGTSMHPTLQMGWRVHVQPAKGLDLRPGEIAVFRGEHHLVIHRLVWIEKGPQGTMLVFRGDYNRVRERIAPEAVLGRAFAIEAPSSRRTIGRIEPIGSDVLSRFYFFAWLVSRPIAALIPKVGEKDIRPGPAGRAARAVFAAIERALSVFLPNHP